jgi:hypothetical protein
MKTLAELRTEAESNKETREKKMFLVFPNGNKQIARFADPFMGLIIFDELPNNVVYIKELEEFKIQGMWLDN